jgi:hypothetical protein
MRAFNCLPQWLRLGLRQRPMQAVVITLDAAQPLWLTTTRVADHIARLASVLLANGFVVTLAVTKLLHLRGACLALAKGTEGTNPRILADSWKVAEDAIMLNPQSCYESFVYTYLQRTQSAIQVAAKRLHYPLPDKWPRLNANLLDVITFRGAEDYKEWKAESRATFEQPNYLYIIKQLKALTDSLLPEPGTAAARELDFDRPHIT